MRRHNIWVSLMYSCAWPRQTLLMRAKLEGTGLVLQEVQPGAHSNAETMLQKPTIHIELPPALIQIGEARYIAQIMLY